MVRHEHRVDAVSVPIVGTLVEHGEVVGRKAQRDRPPDKIDEGARQSGALVVVHRRVVVTAPVRGAERLEGQVVMVLAVGDTHHVRVVEAHQHSTAQRPVGHVVVLAAHVRTPALRFGARHRVVDDLLHVAFAARTDRQPLDLSDDARQQEVALVASNPRLAQFEGLDLVLGAGLAALRCDLREDLVLIVAFDIAALVPNVGMLGLDALGESPVEHRPLGLVERVDSIATFGGLDRDSAGQLVGAVEDGRHFEEFDLLQDVRLPVWVVGRLDRLVANRPLLILAEKRNGVECLATALALEVELDPGEQSSDACGLHLGGESGVVGRHLVDGEDFADGLVPVVAPDDAWLAASEAAVERTGGNDVADGVLVADSGDEALDDALRFVDVQLPGDGFEVEVSGSKNVVVEFCHTVKLQYFSMDQGKVYNK